MIGPESRLTYFTEEVKSAIERDPIVLGFESIGSHFRNPEEVYDIEQVIAEQAPPISVGLVGDRLSAGKFAYTPKELFDKLSSYGQKDVQLKALGNMIYRRHGLPPESYQKIFIRLSYHLKNALNSNTNLDHIDLTAFPPYLMKFLTFVPYHAELPFVYHPKGFENLDPSIPVLQRPAAYFPDIDIAFITDRPLRGVLAFRPENRTIGKLSGTCIQVIPIYPALELESEEQQEVVDSMLENYRPFPPIPKSSHS